MPSLSQNALQNLIKLLGDNVPTSHIEKLIKEVDIAGDNQISFEEFLVMFRTDNYKTAKEEFTKQDSAITSDIETSVRSEP
jgi:Ca2+-binding EF-hand superfamily protein